MMKRVIAGLLALMCVIGIFYLTCQTPEQTWEITRDVQKWLQNLGITVGGKALRHYIHYVIYFIFGIILFIWKENWWMILVGFGVGLLDEGLKIWLPTREFDWTDLLRDFAGIITAFLLVICVRRIWQIICHLFRS